ncbi:MAG: zinc-ribbon domain-containing protein, partial [Pseudonocardiaceae bacterium]
AAWSRERAWWRCSTCGFEWQAAVDQRVRGRSRCPRCLSAQRRQQLRAANTRRLEVAPPRVGGCWCGCCLIGRLEGVAATVVTGPSA